MFGRNGVALCMTLLAHAAIAQTQLSPRQVGGGEIPAVSGSAVFTLSNGDWVDAVRLPARSADGATLKVASQADWGTQVLQAGTDVPLPSLPLGRGETLEYRYSAGKSRWMILAPTVRPRNDGTPLALQLPRGPVTRVVLSDGAWAPSVVLPPSAPNNTVVLVTHNAAWASRVSDQNLLHDYTTELRRGNDYAFLFNERLGKWTVAATVTPPPPPPGQPPHGGQLDIPVPVNPMTRVTIDAAQAPVTVHLPPQAGDRDRVVIDSRSSVPSTIDTSNVEGGATMTVATGQTYEFMWLREKSRWYALRQPVHMLRLTQTPADRPMPAPLTSTTEVVAGNGNWQAQLILPDQARPGDRVAVKSSAAWPFQVTTPGASGFGSYTVTEGEEVSFVRNGDGSWARETDTIRLLLTYGQSVVNRLGESAAQARQLESLRLTNEALGNSGSRFRFQAAGVRVVPDLGRTLDEALSRARTHTYIQAERDATRADAVYYEGVEDGCGLAWLNSRPDASNMVATGSLNCGTTVMRHELGHNMGLEHGDGMFQTVMSGNALPYYATPNRYDARLGLPLGQGARQPDEVAVMDRNAPSVARFR